METIPEAYEALEEYMQESERVQRMRKRLAYNYEEGEREGWENE